MPNETKSRKFNFRVRKSATEFADQPEVITEPTTAALTTPSEIAQPDLIPDEVLETFKQETGARLAEIEKQKQELAAYEAEQPFLMAEAAEEAGVEQLLAPLDPMAESIERVGENIGKGNLGKATADVVSTLIHGTGLPATIPLNMVGQAVQGTDLEEPVGDVMGLLAAPFELGEGLGIEDPSYRELANLGIGMLLTGGTLKAFKGAKGAIGKRRAAKTDALLKDVETARARVEPEVPLKKVKVEPEKPVEIIKPKVEKPVEPTVTPKVTEAPKKPTKIEKPTELPIEKPIEKPVPKKEPKIEVPEDKGVKRKATDTVIKEPIEKLDPELNKKVVDTAKEFINELKNASIEKRKGFGSETLGIGQTKSFTINTFPDWFSGLGRNRKDVLAALNKIVKKDVTEKGTLVEDLKAEIFNRLTGRHEEAIRTGVSGKFKREVLGKIDEDFEFTEFLSRVADEDLTITQLNKRWKEFQKEATFDPAEFAAFTPDPKPKVNIASNLDEYKTFKKEFNKKDLTVEQLTDQLFDLNTKKLETPYGFRQTKDVGKALGEKLGKDIIVDKRNIWVDGQRVKNQGQLNKLITPEVPTKVKLTPEAQARKAAAEGIVEPKPKKIEPKPAQPKAKPRTANQVMREDPTFTVKTLHEATKLPKTTLAKQIQDLKANKLIDRVQTKKGTEWKATDEFKTLLDDMTKNPKDYGADLAQLNSNPIPQVLKGLSKAVTFLDDIIEKGIGRPLYNALGKGLNKIVPERVKEQVVTNYGLPKEYTTLRRNARDSMDRYNELAKDIGNLLKFKAGEGKTGVKFTPAEQKRLGQIVKGSVTTNPLFKERGGKAIKEIAELERLGKQLEVLPMETYNTKLPRKRIHELLTKKRRLEQSLPKLKEIGDKKRVFEIENQIKGLDSKVKKSFKHGGEGYMKRVFLTKEQAKNFQRYGYTRPTRLDLTSAMARKDIPFEIRRQMGEVLEAAYPVSKGIALEGKDVSLGNFFKAIDENPNWVGTSERPGFVKMPKDPRLGKLSEKFVEERIAKDLNDVIKMTSDENMDKMLKQINSIWKATKTIMNPSTHFRNVMSNSVMLDFSGVPHLEQARILPEAIKAIRGTGKYADDFKASRLKSTTFTKEELGKFLDVVGEQSLGNLTAPQKVTKLYGKISGVDTKLGKKLGDYYQMEETIFKAIKFIAEREKGKSIPAARAEANKWLFDYGEIPKAVQFMRENPLLGMPFVTWSYKALPRVIETAIARPLSFWKYPVIFGELTRRSLEKLDMSKEEWENLKTTFPERLANGEWLLLPFRDDNGRMQMLDLTYILPYKDAYDLAMSGYSLATSGQLRDGRNVVEGMAGMLNAPVTTTISELMSNKNTYTGQPIWSEADKPSEQAAKIFDYIYKLYMPSLTPEIPFGDISKGGYSWHKLSSTIQGKEDYYGRNFSLLPAIGSSLFGVKTTPIDPERFAESKFYRLQGRLIEFNKKASRIERDPTLSDKEKDKRLLELEEEIAKIKDEQKGLGVR